LKRGFPGSTGIIPEIACSVPAKFWIFGKPIKELEANSCCRRKREFSADGRELNRRKTGIKRREPGISMFRRVA
jgi:hypothetical protein